MPMSRARRRRVVLAALVLAAAAVGAGAYAVRQARLSRNMERWLAEGTAAHERGDYAAALENLNEYVSRDKTNPQALLDLADARRHIPTPNNQHLPRAIAIVQTALALEPDSLEGRLMLMELFSDSGFASEARDAAERVLDLDAKNIAAHQIRVAVSVAAGRPDDIIATARHMAREVPDDLTAQRYAFFHLVGAGVEPDELTAFVKECEARFEPQVGLELMRTLLADAAQARARQGSQEQLDALATRNEHLVRAASMEISDAGEAADLIAMLDAASTTLPENLADQTLARLMQQPALAPKLATLAAERAWGAGDADGAGKAIVQSIPDLHSAGDEALGWLAISPLPEGGAAREILASRTSAEATQWARIAEANAQLQRAEPLAAGATLATLTIGTRNSEAVARHLQGMADAAVGEFARAVARWRPLLDAKPAWYVTRDSLLNAYLALGELEQADEILSQALTGRGLAPLELFVRRAEDDPAQAPRALMFAERVLAQMPEHPTVRVWAARAFLAAGESDRALSIVDEILAADPSPEITPAAALSNRLQSIDPDRADALRRHLQSQADAADAFQLASAYAAVGSPEEGRAMLERGVQNADPAERHGWRLALAAYLDTIGEPDVPVLLELSAQAPDDLLTQQIVLASTSVWSDPASLEPVIARLRSITGQNGVEWQVYSARRELLMLRDAPPDAQQRATGIVLALAPVLREDPRHLLALDTAAEAATILRDNSRAAEYLLRAVRLDPGDFARRMRLLQALTRAGRVEEARQHAREMASLPIDDPAALRARADVLRRFGLSDLAHADWQRLAGTGNTLATINIAASMAARGDIDGANEKIGEVLQSQSLDEATLLQLASFFAETGREARGLEILERLPESGESGPRSRHIGKYRFLTCDDVEEARDIERLAGATGDPVIWSYAVMAYQQVGLGQDARRALHKGFETTPDSPDLLALRRAYEAEDAGDPAARLAWARGIINLVDTPEAEAVVALYDDRFAGRLDADALIDRLTAITAESPLAPSAWIGLATAQYAAGRTDDMRTTLLRAIDALPASMLVADFALSLFKGYGMAEDALFAARALRERSGGPNFGADREIAVQLCILGRSREALTVLDPWRAQIESEREREPGNAYLLAVALAAANDASAAMDLLSPLIETAPEGLLYCIDLNADFTDIEARRAWLTQITPRALGADDAAHLAIVNAWHAFAVKTGRREDVLECARVAEEAIALSAAPSPELLLPAATAYDHLGDYDRAVTHYRAIAALRPDDPRILNNLAYALLLGGDPAEALRLAEQALQIAERTGATSGEVRSFLDTQGQIFLRLGRTHDALRTYRRTLDLDGDWPVAIVGFAEALRADGQAAEARRTIERLDPAQLPDHLRARVETLRKQLSDA